MATVYDFLNADSSEVEEQRVIRVAGTTGDVLTLQANGTVSPAPGGGSQTFKLVPRSVDFTDIPADGNEVTLFTPDAGDVVLDGYIDPATYVPWNGASGGDLRVGPTPVDGNNFRWQINVEALPDSGDHSLATMQVAAATAQSPVVGGSGIPQPTCVSSGAAWKAKNDGLADATAGHIDFLFLVATPEAP